LHNRAFGGGSEANYKPAVSGGLGTSAKANSSFGDVQLGYLGIKARPRNFHL
jgi:hypothetical protein